MARLEIADGVERFLIQLPIPDSALSKNARVHWARRHRIYQEHVDTAIILTRAALQFACPAWTESVGLEIRWLSRIRRWPDVDNCAARCSAYIDGVERAGLLSNDRVIDDLRVRRDLAPAGTPPCVELIFSRKVPS